MVTPGYAWLCLGTPGYAWVRLVMPGYAWGGYAWAKPLLVKDAMGDKIGMGEGGPIIGALIKKALLTVGLFKTNVTSETLKAIQDGAHIPGRGKDIPNLIGRITGVTFTAGTQKDTGHLQGTLELLAPESLIATKIKDAWDKGMVDLFGFFIDTKSKSQRGRIGSKAAHMATKFIAVNSVDLIVDPGAGGGVINLIESNGTQTMEEETILSTDDVAPLWKQPTFQVPQNINSLPRTHHRPE